jgi:hypothetical protein
MKRLSFLTPPVRRYSERGDGAPSPDVEAKLQLCHATSAERSRYSLLYMCLINYDPSQPPGEFLQPKHAELEAELRERGVYVSGAGLTPVEAGGSVRIKDGRPMTIDGPFAETKEVLGGYYILHCATLDEAVQHASRIPVESRSWVDVRPIFLFHPNIDKIGAVEGLAH